MKHYHAEGDSLGYVDGYCYMLLYRVMNGYMLLYRVMDGYRWLWVVIGGYGWL